VGCVIFRNNLNWFWDFYHGTKPPTWVLVHPKALSTSLPCPLCSSSPNHRLHRVIFSKRKKQTNVCREQSKHNKRKNPTAIEREIESLLSLFFMGPLSLSLHVRLPLGRVQCVHSSSSSYPVPCSLPRLTRIHNFSCLDRLHENAAAVVRLLPPSTTGISDEAWQFLPAH
jgi:hypothetical protein